MVRMIVQGKRGIKKRQRRYSRTGEKKRTNQRSQEEREINKAKQEERERERKLPGPLPHIDILLNP